MPELTIIEVAVPLPLSTTFYYLVPPNLIESAQPGKRVLVPFGRRKLTGYVLGFAETANDGLKEILEVLDQEELFTARELEFCRWIANYYLHSLGEVLKSALPAGINITAKNRTEYTDDGMEIDSEHFSGGRKVKTGLFYHAIPGVGDLANLSGKRLQVVAYLQSRGDVPASTLRSEIGISGAMLRKLTEDGWLGSTKREIYRDPFRAELFEHDMPLQLNHDQQQALEKLSKAIDAAAFSPFLLFGVTGSGKTEVYLQAIAHCLSKKRTALVLVPEIALTPQLVRRFKKRFHCGIAVLHSGLSGGERYDEWRRIRRNEISIVIGARSAIFAPLENLGMIVVDEEHEASYKQSEGLRYNARDLALVRGKMVGACVLLGSATPLVTTFHAVQTGRLGFLQLPKRVRNLPMPDTDLVDTRNHKGKTFSGILLSALEATLSEGGQALLFLNRRGFATFLICEECGHVFQCPNCSVTLTYHRQRGRHFCHYCDYSIPAPSICPTCSSPEISLLGRGTERLEDEIRQLFPQARVSRMDKDTTKGRGGHARVLKGLEDGSIDILIGTQMIAKGHDFPGVTLVGVVSADAALNLPDFRSAERTFQLVTQVMGRAGRGDQPGRVIIQTYAPDHYAISHAVAHDFEGFCAVELAHRNELGYPPFSHLAGITLSSIGASMIEEWAAKAAAELKKLKALHKCRVEILGPAIAPLGMIRGRHRRQILLKSNRRSDLHRLLQQFKATLKFPGVVRLSIDIDPVDML